MMHENPRLFEKTFPKSVCRHGPVLDALNWIEECMGWTAMYVRMDAGGKRNGKGLGRIVAIRTRH
jgi:hypothetical protein